MATIKTDTYDIDIKNINSKLDQVIKKNQTLEKTNKKTGKSLLEVGSQVALVYSGVSQVFNQLATASEKYTKAFAIQEKAEQRVKTLLGDNIKVYTDYASAIQKVTTVGDEQVLQLQALASSLGVADNKINKTVKQAIGLAKAFEMAGLSQELALKGLSGNITLLTRYIPALKDASSETEKMAILQEKAAQGFKIATDEAKTAGGQLQQLENISGDLDEEIGKKLIPTIILMKKTWLEATKGMLDAVSSPEFGKIIAKIFNPVAARQLEDQLEASRKAFENIGFTIQKNMTGEDQLKVFMNIWTKSVNEVTKAYDTIIKTAEISAENEKDLNTRRIDNIKAEAEEVTGLAELKKEIDEEDYWRKHHFNKQLTEDIKVANQEQLESIQENISIISNLQTSISDIFSQMSMNRMIELDNEYKKQKDNINKNIKDERAREQALEKLDKDYQEKKRAQQKKNAEAEKVAALFQVAINTASAVVEALPNIPLSIAVGALGAVQAGVIAAQPIPEFATGVVGLNGAGTGTSDSNLARLSRGESVVTAAGTSTGNNAEILRNMNSGQSFVAESVNDTLKGITAMVANQGRNIVVNNEVTRDGLTTTVIEGSSDFDNDNNKTELESSL